MRQQVACEMFICRKRSDHLVEKIISPVIFDTNRSFKRQNALSFSFCVSHASSCLQDVYLSKAFQRPCQKNYISGHIWHKSFIQTVKCSFFNQIIVNHSFYGALFTFSYILLQGKVLCFPQFGKLACEMFIVCSCQSDLMEKIISPAIFDTNRSLKQ